MMEFLRQSFTVWWGIVLWCIVAAAVLFLLSALLYKVFFKRFYDIMLSAAAIIVLSPVLLVVTIVTAIKMKGNPFFVQKRPGKNGKIFSLIKFRSMTSEKDAQGNLLPEEKRLTPYGRALRRTSLDELPELFNIFIGNMSIIGPRPLRVEYLPRYNEFQRHRHDVRPGLSGWAQVNGRNALTWEKKFEYDVYYVRHVSLLFDLKILFMTVGVVLGRGGINDVNGDITEDFMGTPDCHVAAADKKGVNCGNNESAADEDEPAKADEKAAVKDDAAQNAHDAVSTRREEQ